MSGLATKVAQRAPRNLFCSAGGRRFTLILRNAFVETRPLRLFVDSKFRRH
jgi:hypothetical protein